MPDVRPNPEVVFRRLEDEGVLVHLGTNRIYSLNRTGARLWELVAAGHGRSEVKEEMLSEFDVTEQQLEREIETLVSSLLDEGLFTVASSR